jgi:hypothetical protein
MFLDLALSRPVLVNGQDVNPIVGNAATDGAMLGAVRGEGMQFQRDLYRPFIDNDGRRKVWFNRGRTTNEKGQQVPIKEKTPLEMMMNQYGIYLPVWNTTMLRKEEWIELDKRVVKAARYRLRLWSDLMAAVPYGGFNGMSKSMLEWENMSDPGEAVVDMDGLTPGRTDAPQFGGQGLPLPITHCDFWFSSRKLAESRNSNTPLDSTMGEAAGRRVAETVEKTAIGVATGIQWGGLNTALTYTNASAVYGLTNFPQRLTYTSITAPTTGGWSPATTLSQVLYCINLLKLNKFFGPFMVYTSNDWDPYLDNDYYYALTSGAVAPTKSLRTRLKENPDIIDVRRLDFLFGSQPSLTSGNQQAATVDAVLKPFRFLFVQMTSEVIEAVNGMDLTTLQWESVGGMRLNFKAFCIQVPRLKSDQYGNCGILDATTS